MADDELAARLGCGQGSGGCASTTTRSDPQQPERPIAWTTVYSIRPMAEAVRRQVHQSTELVSTIIEQAYGIYVAEIDQEIRAIAVPARIAPCSSCEPETPALEITRHYRDHAGRVFEITISVQPAERFSYAPQAAPAR